MESLLKQNLLVFNILGVFFQLCHDSVCVYGGIEEHALSLSYSHN